MFFVTAILLLLSSIIFFNNPKGSSNRWGAGFAFMCSLGTLGRVIEFSLPQPLTALMTAFPLASIIRDFVMSVGYWCGIYYAPYFLLKYSLLSSGTLKKPGKYLGILLHIPIFASLIFESYPIRLYSPNYRVLLLYVIPYCIFSASVMLYSANQAIHFKERRSKLLAAWMVTVVFIVCCVLNYACPAFGLPINDWLNLYAAAFAFIVFVVAAYYFGNFGVRIKFESINLSSIEAVNTGASLMNHAIKNELALISQSINVMEKNMENMEVIKKNLDRVKNSTGSLLSFINQVQDRIKPDRHLNEEIDLRELIDDSLNISAPLIEEKSIRVIRKVEGDWFIRGDRRRLLEVFNNIIANAVEAMDRDGVLKIKIYPTRFSLMVDFEDDGCGIVKEHLSHVIEPFFSTKHFGHNYGLGLTFCYNVAKDHGGSLEIESEPHKGTHVTIKFPKAILLTSAYTGTALKH